MVLHKSSYHIEAGDIGHSMKEGKKTVKEDECVNTLRMETFSSAERTLKHLIKRD